ncbi:MAG: hypothetical protein ACI8VE_001659, partial [Natrialbaceae archaeon]
GPTSVGHWGVRDSPMETLLAEQTTADGKIITPPWNSLSPQPAGGQNVFCGAVAVRR